MANTSGNGKLKVNLAVKQRVKKFFPTLSDAVAWSLAFESKTDGVMRRDGKRKDQKYYIFVDPDAVDFKVN